MKYTAIIKIFVLSCFFSWLVACDGLGSDGKIQTPVISSENSAVPENVIVEASDPVEVVKKAYEKMSAARSYRSRHELTGPTGVAITTDMEIVAPDRIRSVQTGTGMETIVIGGDFYIKTPGSAWEKSDFFSSKPEDLAKGQEIINKSLKNLTNNVKAVGSDTVDGKPVMIYQYSLSLPNQDKDEAVVKLWIGARDNLIYKYEYESETKIDDKSLKMKSVIKFYDFGADIKIEPPI